jgi:PAS domain S-box-containing protein
MDSNSAQQIIDGSVIAFHTDITEIKKSEERFSRIFQSNPALVSISTAEEAIILEVNEVWLKTLGFEKSEVIGRTPYALNIFGDNEIRNRAIRRVDQGV